MQVYQLTTEALACLAKCQQTDLFCWSEHS